MWGYFLSIGFSLAATGPGPSPVPIRTLSLNDCVSIALQNSTTVLKGSNDVALAGTQVLAAYG